LCFFIKSKSSSSSSLPNCRFIWGISVCFPFDVLMNDGDDADGAVADTP
jgi:hypothetical protein